MRTALIVAAAVVSIQAPSEAQGTRIIDEGSFTITANGRTVGRENFRISAVPRGDVTDYVARADVTTGDRRMNVELRTGPEGEVVDYTVTTRTGNTTESWNGGVVRGRLTAKITSGRGTAGREYMITPGSLLLDDRAVHQYWFVTHRSREGTVPVVAPREGDIKGTVTVSVVGEEQIQIGRHDLVATHVRTTVSGGDATDIWIDKSGRLLKVAIPAKGIVAVRDDPPPA